jgi:hypothetical protein
LILHLQLAEHVQKPDVLGSVSAQAPLAALMLGLLLAKVAFVRWPKGLIRSRFPLRKLAMRM